MNKAGRNEVETIEHKEDIMLLPKYAYSDLTVYMRVGENAYLNITDYSVMEEENERITLQSESPFVVMFCSFLYTFQSNVKPWVCDLSFNELMQLSGVQDKEFTQRFVNKFGEKNKELLAILCAKKVLDYQYGNIVKEPNNKCSFYRLCCVKKNDKYVKRKRLVFTKDLYAV